MSYASLEAAGHGLPKEGSSSGTACLAVLIARQTSGDASHDEYAKEQAQVADLAARRADEDNDAQKKLTKLLKQHAETHLQAMYLEALLFT
eukprot:499756-Pleurochrysis_carterae.AAC.1